MTGYASPSTGQTVRAVLFDTFGTVVDWRSGISSAVRAFAADPDGNCPRPLGPRRLTW